MRKDVLRLFMVLALCVVGWRLTVKLSHGPVSEQPSSQQPIIEYPAAIDLGDRSEGEHVIVPFQLANNGDAPLELEAFSSSCSCAGIEQVIEDRRVTVEKMSIPAHSKVDVSIRLVVRGLPGQDTRVISSFRSNDPNRPQCAIEVIIPRIFGVSCSPVAVMFNQAITGQEESREIAIRG